MNVAGLVALLLLIAAPVAAVWYLLRWLGDASRRNPDLCTCGYDLRATPGRCPECGTVWRHSGARYQQLKRLREEWPAEDGPPREPGPDEQRVVVHSTDDGMLAALLAQHLEARGMACEVREPEAIGLAGAKQMYGSYKLAVWEADEGLARAVVGWLLEGVTEQAA